MTEEGGPGEPIPAGWTEHDMAAREKVRRFVGNLSGALGLAEIIGEPDYDPEFTTVKHGNQPLEPTVDGDWKQFDLTVDQMEWQIDAMKEPVKALGYNAMWPGPALRVTEGDKVRINVTNNLDETTGDAVFELLLELAQTTGAGLLIVTHSERLAARADRRLVLSHGQLGP